MHLRSIFLVALVRFENNLFDTNNTSSKTFDDIYDSAMSGVSSLENILNNKFNLFLNFICYSISALIVFRILRKRKSTSSYTREYAPLDIGNKISKNEVTYLLNYVKKGWIKISKTKDGLFNFRNNNYFIDLTNLSNLQAEHNELDKKFIEILIQSSGSNTLLEAKEFENWCKANYSTINYWFENVINYQTTKLQQKRLITETIETKRNKTIITRHVDSAVRNQAIQLLGLKQFLLDYSLIAEKTSIELDLWENYLIFAQLLGIAEKVEEQFSKIYPDFNKLSKINTGYTTFCTRTLSVSIIDIVLKETLKQKRLREKASRSHYYSGRDRNSGGGGSSYSSGGSSSGGSSGGGFR